MQRHPGVRIKHGTPGSQPERHYVLAGRMIAVPTLRLYVRTLLGVALWLAVPPLLAGVLGRLGARGTMHALERWWARRVAGYLDIHLDMEGLEHIDPHAVYVVTPLHEGFADVLALLHLPLDLRFAARDELFTWRFLGRYLRAAQHINVSPEQGSRGYRRLLKAAADVFAAGESLVMFPQGTILGIETDFMPGAFRLARAMQRPVLPVALTGSHRVWEYPFTPRLRYGERISLRVLPPIPAEAVRNQDAEAMRCAIQRQLKAVALGGTMASPRRFVPERDGYWDGYEYRIDAQFPELAEQVALHRKGRQAAPRPTRGRRLQGYRMGTSVGHGSWSADSALPGDGAEVTVVDTIVVGAGQAGLAAGYHLQRAGLHFTILEAGAGPVGSWPHYYDSLKLFSPARYASLPGLPFPADPDQYPSRDEVIAYLTRYAAHFRLPVITGARVEHIHKEGTTFCVTTANGELYRTRILIAATGSFHQPYLPQIPGQREFLGRILHSAAYRNPDPYRDQRVVVVGGGNSAVQIAVELAQVAHVTLATRAPLKLTPQHILGRDIHFWARVSGLEQLPLGHWARLREINPVLDTGSYRTALATGRPDRRPMFTSFTAEGVIWADGSREVVDTVVFATGYRPNLAYLAGVGALDVDGRARQRAGVSTTTPGLYYVGLPAQRVVASATLRGVGADAGYVVAHLRRHLRSLLRQPLND